MLRKGHFLFKYTYFCQRLCSPKTITKQEMDLHSIPPKRGHVLVKKTWCFQFVRKPTGELKQSSPSPPGKCPNRQREFLEGHVSLPSDLNWGQRSFPYALRENKDASTPSQRTTGTFYRFLGPKELSHPFLGGLVSDAE